MSRIAPAETGEPYPVSPHTHGTRRARLTEPPISTTITSNSIEGPQLHSTTQSIDKVRPFTTPNAKASVSSNILADWAELRIGPQSLSKRVDTSHSMSAVRSNLSGWTQTPGARRPATRGGKLHEEESFHNSNGMARPVTQSAMASRGRTACTSNSNMSANEFDLEFWHDQDSTLPSHFRLKSSANEQSKGRMSNISIRLPEHTPASFVASKSLQFLARYKEVSSTKYRVGSKSLRLQKTLELLADIASTQEQCCPALGFIYKDLASEIFSHECEGHDCSGVAINMTWQALCGNLLREKEDAESKLSYERSQNEALRLKNQSLAAESIAENEKLIAVQIKNDIILAEQKARLDEVQQQKIKLQELSASHQELEAAFWSSDVTRRAYKSSLVHEANIQMSTTQQYMRKSEDAFQQLLTVHKETLAKAHEIQRDSYAKDDLVTKLLNEIKETTLIHTRQEGLLVVYQDRVNSSVAKAIYDAVEDDLTKKNSIVMKLEEENSKLNAMVSLLEKEREVKSQKGRNESRNTLGTAELMKSFVDFKQHGKPTVASTSKGKNTAHSEEVLEGGDGQDEVVIPNFFADGLCRRPGRVGELGLSLLAPVENN